MTPTRTRIVGGRYRLDEPIGEGGMGTVWSATHVHRGGRVAVKLMTPTVAGTPEGRARFEREARAAAALRSAHVVRALDFGREDDTPFLVMEYLEGEDLRALLLREGTLSLRRASTLVGQVCQGLDVAHGAGIVHRDLKPGNIFLARLGDGEIVKILDFGVAKALTQPGELGGDSTKTGMLLGSPRYMSPEQARAQPIDHRSDLWTVGVIVFEMITGRRPFGGEDMVDALVRICTDPLPVPSLLAPHLPAAIDRFFERALARDPGRRFGSGRELATALAAIVEAHPGASDAVSPASSPQRVRVSPCAPEGRAPADDTASLSQPRARPPRVPPTDDGEATTLEAPLRHVVPAGALARPRASLRVAALGFTVVALAGAVAVASFGGRPTSPPDRPGAEQPVAVDPSPAITEISPSATASAPSAPLDTTHEVVVPPPSAAATPSATPVAPPKSTRRSGARSAPATTPPAPSTTPPSRHPVFGI